MLENWLSKFDDNERRVMLVGQPHYIGLFENVVMILFLTISSILHLCRLFSGVLMVATVDAPTARRYDEGAVPKDESCFGDHHLGLENRGQKHNLIIDLDPFFFSFSPISQWTALFCNNLLAVYTL